MTDTIRIAIAISIAAFLGYFFGVAYVFLSIFGMLLDTILTLLCWTIIGAMAAYTIGAVMRLLPALRAICHWLSARFEDLCVHITAWLARRAAPRPVYRRYVWVNI